MSSVFDERVEFAVQHLWVVPEVEKRRPQGRAMETPASFLPGVILGNVL